MSLSDMMNGIPEPPEGKKGWPWTVPESLKGERTAEFQEQPLVSLITPSLNQSRFLEETIRSVLLQGYPNLEYIIMDGMSTDGSQEIIKKYGKHLSHWESEPDKGHNDAVNKGWKIAKGEFVSWLNSDDFLFPHSLETAVDILKKNPDIHVCYGDAARVNERSQSCDRDFKGGDFSLKDMLVFWKNPVPQPGFLMRRSVIDQIGFLDESYSFAFDFEYWIRMAVHDMKGMHIPQKLAAFRMHRDAKTYTKQDVRIKDRFGLYEQYFQDERISQEFKKKYLRKSKNKLYLNAADIFYKRDDPEKLKKFALQGIQESKWNVPAYLYLCISLFGKKGIAAAKKTYGFIKGLCFRQRHKDEREIRL